MTQYKGMYAQRLSDGKIYNVQVVDATGNSMTMDPDEYIRRRVEPDIAMLPTIPKK